jgi:hypothetical protein
MHRYSPGCSGVPSARASVLPQRALCNGGMKRLKIQDETFPFNMGWGSEWNSPT